MPGARLRTRADGQTGSGVSAVAAMQLTVSDTAAIAFAAASTPRPPTAGWTRRKSSRQEPVSNSSPSIVTRDKMLYDGLLSGASYGSDDAYYPCCNRVKGSSFTSRFTRPRPSGGHRQGETMRFGHFTIQSNAGRAERQMRMLSELRRYPPTHVLHGALERPCTKHHTKSAQSLAGCQRSLDSGLRCGRRRWSSGVAEVHSPLSREASRGPPKTIMAGDCQDSHAPLGVNDQLLDWQTVFYAQFYQEITCQECG
jgi:hypothetical protein